MYEMYDVNDAWCVWNKMIKIMKFYECKILMKNAMWCNLMNYEMQYDAKCIMICKWSWCHANEWIDVKFNDF